MYSEANWHLKTPGALLIATINSGLFGVAQTHSNMHNEVVLYHSSFIPVCDVQYVLIQSQIVEQGCITEELP